MTDLLCTCKNFTRNRPQRKVVPGPAGRAHGVHCARTGGGCCTAAKRVVVRSRDRVGRGGTRACARSVGEALLACAAAAEWGAIGRRGPEQVNG